MKINGALPEAQNFCRDKFSAEIPLTEALNGAILLLACTPGHVGSEVVAKPTPIRGFMDAGGAAREVLRAVRISSPPRVDDK
ncbi:MAG: hypothetical protein H5T86_06350 [Armatimonadetes bacterium]|nr:hypothetical protein [Armatimonadota bacterium]